MHSRLKAHILEFTHAQKKEQPLVSLNIWQENDKSADGSYNVKNKMMTLNLRLMTLWLYNDYIMDEL